MTTELKAPAAPEFEKFFWGTDAGKQQLLDHFQKCESRCQSALDELENLEAEIAEQTPILNAAVAEKEPAVKELQAKLYAATSALNKAKAESRNRSDQWEKRKAFLSQQIERSLEEFAKAKTNLAYS